MTLRQSELRALGRRMDFSTSSLEVLTESYRNRASLLHRRAFLSHSHLDQVMAVGLKRKLAQVGIKLYVDWLDLTEPRVTDVNTARRIQEAIRNCDYFLYLVTANSAKSIWCPWELGYADGIASLRDNIYVVPTMDDDDVEHGKEYLGLYRIMDLYCEENGTERFVYHDAQDMSRHCFRD